MRIILILIFIMSQVQSCAPFIGGIGAVALTSTAKEKGLGTSISDNVIHIKILNAIFKYKEELPPDISVSVNDGSILLTGKIKNVDDKIEITKIVWDVKGVKEVNNKIQVTDMSNLKNIARDLASLGEIKARLIASKELNSLNFSIDVVNNVAYVSGIAESEKEILLVTKIIQKARFVTEVQNFIKLTQDIR